MAQWESVLVFDVLCVPEQLSRSDVRRGLKQSGMPAPDLQQKAGDGAHLPLFNPPRTDCQSFLRRSHISDLTVFQDLGSCHVTEL